MYDTDLSEKMYALQQWACFALEKKVHADRQLRDAAAELERVEGVAYARSNGTVDARKRAVSCDPEVVECKAMWSEAKQVCDLVESYISRYDRMNALLSRELTRRLNKRSQV